MKRDTAQRAMQRPRSGLNSQIYLSNALEEAHDFSEKLREAFPSLAQEAEAVNHIKKKEKFLVVLGNPPYSGHSANKPVIRDKKDLLDDYKKEPGGKEKLKERQS